MTRLPIYLQENPDFENIWTDSSIVEIDKNECMWARDYFEEVEASQRDLESNTRDIVDIMTENPDFEYSKVRMRVRT